MRYFLVLVFLGFLSGCATHSVPLGDERVQFIHDIDATKGEIFGRTVDWMAESFADSKSVIEVEDALRGKIIGKGITQFSAGSPETGWGAYIPTRFTLVVDVKEGRVRSTYKDFTVVETNLPVAVKGYNDQILKKIRLIHQSYIQYLTGEADDSW